MTWLQDGDGNEQSLAVMAGEGMEHTVAALQSSHGTTQVFLRSAQSVSPSDITVDHNNDSKLMFAKDFASSGILMCLVVKRLPFCRPYRTNLQFLNSTMCLSGQQLTFF